MRVAVVDVEEAADTTAADREQWRSWGTARIRLANLDIFVGQRIPEGG